jgi:chaperone BCS1
LSVDTSFVESDSGKISTRYDFQPSVGTHFMLYNGSWVRIERTREQRMMEPWETVQLTTIGNKKSLFIEILEEAREMVSLSTAASCSQLHAPVLLDTCRSWHSTLARPSCTL